MLAKAVAFLKKPYPLNIDLVKSLPFLAVFSILVTLFLVLFQPLGLDRFRHPAKNLLLVGVGIVCFLVLSLNVFLLPKLVRPAFKQESWNIGREIIWESWLCLSTIFILAIYWAHFAGISLTAHYLLVYTVNSILFTMFFMPSCVMLNYIRIIKKRLRTAEAIGARLHARPEKGRGPQLELYSETGTDKLSVPADTLLFIQSSDNYANVVRRKNGKTVETLLRSSLKNLEPQLHQPAFVRCHRSFIVNLTQVRSVNGNARHYTLTLNGHPHSIPISRDSEKEVLQLLEDLNRD